MPKMQKLERGRGLSTDEFRDGSIVGATVVLSSLEFLANKGGSTTATPTGRGSSTVKYRDFAFPVFRAKIEPHV